MPLKSFSRINQLKPKLVGSLCGRIIAAEVLIQKEVRPDATS
jgi:hypothetical protein